MKISDFTIGTRVVVTKASPLMPNVFPLGKMCIIDDDGTGITCIKHLTPTGEVYAIADTLAQFEALDMGNGENLDSDTMNSYVEGTSFNLIADFSTHSDAAYGRFTVGDEYVIRQDIRTGQYYVLDDDKHPMYDVGDLLFFVIVYDPLCTYEDGEYYKPFMVGSKKVAYPLHTMDAPKSVAPKAPKGPKGWEPDVPDPSVDLMKSIHDACNRKF